MSKITTKPSNVQIEKAGTMTAADLQNCMDSASRFLNRFGIVKLLGECGAYKEKGVPVRIILLYIFNLMFSPMSMYYQIKMNVFHEDFSKNTVYRFLENVHMNWHVFLLRLSAVVIRRIVGLTEDKDDRYALLVDDTPLPKCGKAMELVSKYFNHVTMGYAYGYRVLTFAWTDGVTRIPVRYSLLAPPYNEKVKDFQSPSFEAQNAQVAIAFIRYMLIAIEQRESEDCRTCGELFLLFYQELQDITFIKALALIVALFKEEMMKLLGISVEQIQAVVDYVVSALPGYLQRTLSAANEIAQAA